MKKNTARKKADLSPTADYTGLVGGISKLLETARRTSARAVNALMTATYWEIGRRIVEFEQKGKERAEYGESLLVNLSLDLSNRFGRGFGKSNLFLMRKFFLTTSSICQTMSGKSGDTSPTLQNFQTPSGIFVKISDLARTFPLPWSHYVLLVSRSRSPEALDFYHTEALRGGWTVRQLKRQIDSQFYERTALSRDKVAMLEKGDSLVRYSTENLPNKVLVREYLTALPDETTLAKEIASARKKLEARIP